MTFQEALTFVLSVVGVTGDISVRFFAFVGFLGALGLVLGVVYAAIKVIYEQVTERPFPRTVWTRRIDLALQLLVNLPGYVHKARLEAGKSGLFLPSRPAVGSGTQDSTPPSPPAQ